MRPTLEQTMLSLSKTTTHFSSCVICWLMYEALKRNPVFLSTKTDNASPNAQSSLEYSARGWDEVPVSELGIVEFQRKGDLRKFLTRKWDPFIVVDTFPFHVLMGAVNRAPYKNKKKKIASNFFK